MLSACNAADAPTNEAAEADHGEAHGGEHDEETVTLTAEQIALAGVELGRPTNDGAATIEIPAIVEGHPQATQVVSAAIGGRIVALNRNLGEAVGRGQTLAVIESREAAQIKGEVQAARDRKSVV